MAVERDYYDEALEYTELPMDIVVRECSLTPEERREYLIGRVALEYTKCLQQGEHDAKAWNMLSKWLHDLVQVQDELCQRHF
jgi:hypothetical protein